MKTITHLSFLDNVIKNKDQNINFHQACLVFPTWPSMDTFQVLYTVHYPDKGQQPTCLTLSHCIQVQSQMKERNVWFFLHKLYALLKQKEVWRDSFELFYHWGNALLNDFSCIDHHLLDVQLFFQALVSPPWCESLTDKPFPLTHPSSGIHGRGNLLLKGESRIAFYKKLPEIYHSFTELLVSTSMGYPGLMARQASMYECSEQLSSYPQVVFIGLNGLTPAEEQFILNWANQIPALFFWDVDGAYLDQSLNPAGYYLRRYQNHAFFSKTFPKEIEYQLDKQTDEIQLIQATDRVSEVQSILDQIASRLEGNFGANLGEMAIVIHESNHLVPLLEALENRSWPLHCALDYPFKWTIAYNWLEQLVKIWNAPGTLIGCKHTIAAVLLMEPFMEVNVSHCTGKILGNADEQLQVSQFRTYYPDFPDVSRCSNLVNYIHAMGCFFSKHLLKNYATIAFDLNQQAIDFLMDYVGSWCLVSDQSIDGSLLRHLHSVNFLFHQYHPSNGLSIIELNKADNLDFEQLFFLNMGEHDLQNRVPSHSLIPYGLFSHFGIATDEQIAERLLSYGFYRLLKRGKRVVCSYALESSGHGSNQMGRLLLQLLYDKQRKFRSIDQYMPRPTHLTKMLSIPKDEQVMDQLNRFLGQDGHSSVGLTATALMSYLACPLQFYFAYLLRLRHDQPSQKNEVGILLHQVMEQLYSPFIGITLNTDLMDLIQAKAPIVVASVVQNQVDRLGALSSPVPLITALLEKMAHQLLTLDTTRLPFMVVGVELGKDQSLSTTFRLDAEKRVRLSGVIDRVDKQDEGHFEIIDYKTGSPGIYLSDMDTLWSPLHIKKNRGLVQILFYAWLFKQSHHISGKAKITPYMVNIPSLCAGTYKPGVFLKNNQGQYSPIEDIEPYISNFEEGLHQTLASLWDQSTHFTQTSDQQVCAYCPYQQICWRD